MFAGSLTIDKLMSDKQRLNRIVTGKGDKGTTRLGNGAQVTKDDPSIELLGTIDELNSSLGLLLCSLPKDSAVTSCLQPIQHSLFDLGGEIAMASAEYHVIDNQQITSLEQEIERFNQSLPALKEFILPGGSEAAARCHLARSICRRCERRIFTLSGTMGAQVNPLSAVFLNRLSDLLFILARIILQDENTKELLWRPKEKR